MCSCTCGLDCTLWRCFNSRLGPLFGPESLSWLMLSRISLVDAPKMMHDRAGITICPLRNTIFFLIFLSTCWHHSIHPLGKSLCFPLVVTLDAFCWLLSIFASIFCVWHHSNHVILFSIPNTRFGKYENNEQKVIVIFLQDVHQGFPRWTLVRFLKAREWSAPKAHKMVRH
jgi:hypothetical protein